MAALCNDDLGIKRTNALHTRFTSPRLLSASHERQYRGLITDVIQQPPATRSPVQKQRTMRKQKIRRQHKGNDPKHQPSASGSSKSELEAEKAVPSDRSTSSMQDASLCLKGRLQEAVKSGAYSDLTILCEDQKFTVHKVVVCPQSKVLAAAMKKGYKESEMNTIDLSGDGILLVSNLVKFLYTDNYEASAATNRVERPSSAEEFENKFQGPGALVPPVDLLDDALALDKDRNSRDNAISPFRIEDESRVASQEMADPNQSPNYSLNVEMYALSDKYDIPALGQLAEDRFDWACWFNWNSNSFIGSIPRVYESTPESNQGLRTVVLAHARAHANEFMREGPLKSSFHGVLAATPESSTALLSLYMTTPVDEAEIYADWRPEVCMEFY